MATVTGVIEKITTKEYNGKLLYSLVIQGKFYGLGSTKPYVQEGEHISFEAVAKGAYMNANLASIKRVAAAQAETSSGKVPSKATQPANVDADVKAYENKNLSIAYMASYERAVAAVKLFSELGLTLPTLSKAKPNEQLDLFLGLVEATTERIFKATQNHKALNALLDDAAAPVVPKATAKAPAKISKAAVSEEAVEEDSEDWE